MRTYGHVGRTHDLALVTYFFHTMCAPSGDTRDGEDWCIEFQWKTKHLIYKTTVKIDVWADTLVDLALLGNDLRELLYRSR